MSEYTTPKGMDPAYYKFIYVPAVAIIGIWIAGILLQAAIPNTFARYFLVGGGALISLAWYFRKQIKDFS